MRFEYDPRKSRANKAKHGIDFDEAQQLWSDDLMMIAPARTEDSRVFWSSAGLQASIGRRSAPSARAM